MTVKSYFVSFFLFLFWGFFFFLVRGGSYIYIDLLTVLNSINRARRETSASSVMWRCARTLTLLLYGLYLFFLLQKKSSPVAFFFFDRKLEIAGKGGVRWLFNLIYDQNVEMSCPAGWEWEPDVVGYIHHHHHYHVFVLIQIQITC